MKNKNQNKKNYIFLASLISAGLFFVSPALALELKVPFTVQAPDQIWVQPWADACEESVITMVHYFYRNDYLPNISNQKAKEHILHAINLENMYFGYNKDTNASDIVYLINNFYPWEAHLIQNPTLDQIKNEINNNRPVILPVHGKALNNPHFRNGGPDYHTIVISGYDDDTKNFITQEPGTHFGLDYHYSYDTIMDAIHDFVPNGKTNTGQVIAIFTRNEIKDSQNLDADGDGLSKLDEYKYGARPWLADSDRDGFSDKEEIEAGFSPTLNESKLPNNSLIKTNNNPKVYLLSNKIIKHILNESVFIGRGYRWGDIVVVSEKFLIGLEEKAEIVN